jgi:hypothetical protein
MENRSLTTLKRQQSYEKWLKKAKNRLLERLKAQR